MADELIEKILKLKAERRAVILAHNYQLGEVQDLADFVGDSLDLSRKAAETDAAVIVFCGVHFMAETAKILSPDKIVLLPALEAGCPMAEMIDAECLRRKRAEHPLATVVCYVNSSAEVKAESDICCTSANVIQVVSQVPPDREILFVPDQNLGMYAQEKTQRKMILWPGYCPTHMRILPKDIESKRAQYPHALVVVHPECRPVVTKLADVVASTSGLIRCARETQADTVIVGTEMGIIHRLQKENPNKFFVPVCEQAICPNMKLTNLEKILWALEEMQYRVEVPEPVRQRAQQAVFRMLNNH